MWLFYVTLLFHYFHGSLSGRASKSRIQSIGLAISPEFWKSSLTNLHFEYVGWQTATVIISMLPKATYDSGNFVVSLWGGIEPDKLQFLSIVNSFEAVTPYDDKIGFIKISQGFVYPFGTNPQDFYIRGILMFDIHPSVFQLAPFLPANLPAALTDVVKFSSGQNPYSHHKTVWRNPDLSFFSESSIIRATLLSHHIENCYERAQQHLSKLTQEELTWTGISGINFRHFHNCIGELSDLIYFEVGVFRGSTLFSLLKGNEGVRAVALDSWDEGEESTMARLFVENTVKSGKYAIPSHVFVCVSHSWLASPSIVVERFGHPANVYFYDGAHAMSDHYLSLIHYLPSLADVSIYVVSDWGSDEVRAGTMAALQYSRVTVAHRLEILAAEMNTDPTSPWHNGIAVFVILKQQTTGNVSEWFAVRDSTAQVIDISCMLRSRYLVPIL
jgi:hypothetical protein